MERIRSGLTSRILPTRPSLGLTGSLLNVFPSTPEMPTALWPYSLRAHTSCWLTLPTNTSCTASIVASSVTRSPSTKRVWTPRRARRALIALPPPCTNTTRMPMSLSSSRSPTTCRMRRGSSMADPPYFTTMVRPFIWCIQGRASVRTSALRMPSSSSLASRPLMWPP